MDTTTTSTTTTPTPTTTPDKKGEKPMLGRSLTAREMETLKELAAGHTNEETGKALSISVKTVEAHRARLFKKLGASNAPQAIVFAYQQGILKAPLAGYTTEELAAELAKRQPPVVVSS